jgi:hypothetical protein
MNLFQQCADFLTDACGTQCRYFNAVRFSFNKFHENRCSESHNCLKGVNEIQPVLSTF